MRSLLLVSLLLMQGTVWAPAICAQEEPAIPVADPELRRFLLELKEVDQGIRNELAEKGFGLVDSVDIARQEAVDRANLAHLKRIVDKHGWPTGYLVGKDGVAAAFLIIQHADPAFQKKMLPIIRESYQRGDLTGGDYALLTDRVLIDEGLPQRYGTQAQISNGKLVLDPIEDVDNVDERRASLGLQPLAEYVRDLERMYGFEAVVPRGW